MKKKKDPLKKRFLRELRSEFVKYLVIFLLMGFSIAFVSGFLVAADSMIAAYNEGFTKYNVENGHFRTEKKLNGAQRKAIEENGVTLTDMDYAETELTNASTLRIYAERVGVNTVCLMEGELPGEKGQIAVDRMYADNNGIRPGDTLQSGGRVWKVTGLVALPDYSCLFSNNNDSMFDAVAFGVAVVTEEEFEEVSREFPFFPCVSWEYDREPADEDEEREMADSFREVVREETAIVSFVPRYENKAIMFTGEDFSGDSVMMTVLLYIIVSIIAFVFAITTNATVIKEASVIGTLRASGYTRRELLRHYMTLPLLVTLVSAIIGNILGYTGLKYVCASLYYGSYSLPTYVTIWNANAFIKTTVVPSVIVTFVTWFILRRKLTLSPLKFLRRDLSRGKQKRAVPLPGRIPFFTRFRLRVVFQNTGNYLVLFIGVVFANLLLMFGMGLPSVLKVYQADIEQNLIANYQYILSVPADAIDEDRPLESAINMAIFASEIETENEDAEKFSIQSLRSVPEGSMMEEEILLYGITQDSRYVPIELKEGDVYASRSYADKYRLMPGDTVRLVEEFDEESYELTLTGIYEYSGSVALFMDQQKLNRMFDQEDDFFCGYFSDTEITDIDEEYIGNIMDLEALTKISRQIDVSMGGLMKLVNVFALVMFLILIFLLSKMIIEKNAQAISMAKILGYTNKEINRLYNLATTIVVVASIFLSLPIEKNLIEILLRKVFMSRMTGWIPVNVPADVYFKTVVFGVVTYAVVALVELARVRRVPMDEALKNQE